MTLHGKDIEQILHGDFLRERAIALARAGEKLFAAIEDTQRIESEISELTETL